MPDRFLSRQFRFAKRLVLVFVCFWIAILFLVPGCDKQPADTPAEPAKTETVSAPQPISDSIREAWSHYHIHGVDALAQPVACVNELRERVVAFIKTTDQESLDRARNQLAGCKNLYRISKVFVAANPEARTAMESLHQKIGLPLEMPGYIDAVPGYPFSGIVNDASLVISKDELLRQHGLTDISDVSLGFSVIEFLLWGQQEQDTQPRPLQDFIAQQAWSSTDYEMGLGELDIAEHPNNRRRRYLEIAVMILEEHLNQLATLWNKHTLPPLNMTAASELQQDIKNNMATSLEDPDAVTNEPLLTTLIALFQSDNTNNSTSDSTSNDNPDKGADKLLAWLQLDNETAIAELRHPEKPVTAKYAALATLLSVSGSSTETTSSD